MPGLPLSSGYSGAFDSVVASSRVSARAKVHVTGKKRLQVPAGLGLAILAHTAMDGYALWAMHSLGTLWTELGVAALAALILGLALATRNSLAATA